MAGKNKRKSNDSGKKSKKDKKRKSKRKHSGEEPVVVVVHESPQQQQQAQPPKERKWLKCLILLCTVIIGLVIPTAVGTYVMLWWMQAYKLGLASHGNWTGFPSNISSPKNGSVSSSNNTVQVNKKDPGVSGGNTGESGGGVLVVGGNAVPTQEEVAKRLNKHHKNVKRLRNKYLF